ncbi:cathepsin L-like peptidase [Brevipalpus obovatus]|uniref:cathepsin L-like peptidase n=1 Tax=Brevipalpus obovatus TaxID=246614 RepID=UPI003D9F6A83
MKLIIFLAIFSFTLAAPHDHEWSKFKATYNKVYSNAEEEAERYQVFIENLEKINKHNEEARKGLHRYTLGVNKFADLSAEEFNQIAKCSGGGSVRKNLRNSIEIPKRSVNVSALPTSIDWRTKGIVSSVKDQGHCASCYAFSTVAAVEGAIAQSTGQLVELSAQNLVDCSASYGNQGCQDGYNEYSYDYIIANGGLDTEDSYPYVGKDQRCQFNPSTVGGKIEKYATLPDDQEEILQEQVSMRVVSVGIDAQNFQLYHDGIYDTDCQSPFLIDYGFAMVGYGTENGTDYWIVKNSWGQEWGEQGYIRMLRGVNLCGLAAASTYPIIQG